MSEPTQSPAKPIIAVEHVFKSVTDSTGTLDILRDIDFRLESGETVAIVGASGSGKSTLLSIMAGSMLAIATFAVASMVSAYSSASTTATQAHRLSTTIRFDLPARAANRSITMMKPVSSLKNNMAIVLGYSQISGE